MLEKMNGTTVNKFTFGITYDKTKKIFRVPVNCENGISSYMKKQEEQSHERNLILKLLLENSDLKEKFLEFKNGSKAPKQDKRHIKLGLEEDQEKKEDDNASEEKDKKLAKVKTPEKATKKIF